MSDDLVSVLLDAVGTLVVVLDREHRVVRFNRACRELSGYALDEVRGAFLWERMLPAEETDALRIACEQVFAGRNAVALEQPWNTREAGRRLVAWSVCGLADPGGAVACVVLAGTDVTELRADRAAQDALAAAAELFRSVIEHLPSGVLVTGAAGDIVMANGPAQEWLGLPPDAVGTPLSRWVPQAAALVAPAEPSGLERRQLEVNAADSRRRLVGFDSVPCPLPPQGGVVTVFRDIGGFRRAERRRRRAERLAQARALAAGLGGELQAPLAGLLAGVQFLEQEPELPAGQRLVLSSLVQAARRLSRATQEFLDAARSGVSTPRLYALGRLMAETMDPYLAHAASRQVKLDIVPADSDALLAMNVPSIRRALGNLVESAIEAAGREGHVRVEWLELPADEVERRFPGFAGPVAAIRIHDDGPALDEGDLRRVFRPFGSARAVGGGLGLGVAREALELHGAAVAATSRKGGETTFEALFAAGDRAPCWQDTQRSEGLCGVCPVRREGSGYCCWATTGYAEYSETGLWSARCVACPVFRRWHLGMWSAATGPAP